MLLFIERHAKTLSALWLCLITTLFFLPGAALPQEDVLDDIHFDKWVHLVFFALLAFLWRYRFPAGKKQTVKLCAMVVAYGWGVEIIQHYWIPNRSFDLGDVAADTAGAAIGGWLWGYIKKKDPCRNRGRNQN